MANGSPGSYPAPNYPNVWAAVKGYATNLWWLIALVIGALIVWHFIFR